MSALLVTMESVRILDVCYVIYTSLMLFLYQGQITESLDRVPGKYTFTQLITCMSIYPYTVSYIWAPKSLKVIHCVCNKSSELPISQKSLYSFHYSSNTQFATRK